ATYSGTAVGILRLGGTDLVSLTSPVTPLQWSVLIKSTDTVLTTLGRKELPSGAIKGLTLCWLTLCCVCTLQCKHTALYGSAMQSHTKQCAGADRGEICVVYTQVSPLLVILGDLQVPAGN
ncbi:unnamed protein product, partial [Staurois parvus]